MQNEKETGRLANYRTDTQTDKLPVLCSRCIPLHPVICLTNKDTGEISRGEGVGESHRPFKI